MKQLKLSTLLLLGFGLTGLQAQENINATGGNASGSGGSVSYSVGQVAYQTHIGTSGSVVEGVQQPFEITEVTGIEEAGGINLSVSTFPNPTTDFITLKVANYDNENLSYQLYDISGKLLENKKISGNETPISMENLVPAIYFLKVINNHQEIKTFKIVKN